jgi:hypothetical protein
MTEIKNQELTAPAYANSMNGPWTLALRSVEIRDGQPGWRVQCESPNDAYARTIMTYKTYEEALDRFTAVKEGIDTKVPATAARELFCSYCKSKLNDSTAAFKEPLPHLPYDTAYCGCRGWD